MARSYLALPLAFLAFLLLAQARKHLQDESSPSVIIVGAGVAGIMAGKTLSEAGVNDFVILEATGVIGGRMREQDFGGVKVPAGCTWVVAMNETTTNPVWKLVQKYDLKASISTFSNLSHNIYTKDGQLGSSVADPIYQVHQEEEDFLAEFGQKLNAANAPDMSVLAAQRMFREPASEPVEMVLDYFTYDFEFGEPASITSMKHTHPNAIYQDFGADIAVVDDQRGFSYIALKLAEEFLSHENGRFTDPRLKLNTVVKNIQYSPEGVTVKTEGGEIYSSKYVIVTASLGVLQSGLIEFSPPLPGWKFEALNKLDMCVFMRIYLKFPHSFWPQGIENEYFLYADERKGYYPVWQHLDSELPGEHILVVTVTDLEARRIEQQPLDKTKEEMMDVLKSMFGDDIPEASGILLPKWWSNKFFAGTNTNWPVDVQDYEFERVGAHIDSLYFAGEHTHKRYRGNIQGAFYSGIEAAEKLVKCMSGGHCVNAIPEPNNEGLLRRSMTETKHRSFGQKERTGGSDALVEMWLTPENAA